MTPIDIRPADLATVRRILREHVPSLEVRAFGSRVAWNARETSDLDLALMTDEPLSIDRTAKLRAAFTDSDLPCRVDIVDWAAASESFREQIRLQSTPVIGAVDLSRIEHRVETAAPWVRHDVHDLIRDGVLVVGDGYRAKNNELSDSGLPFARAGNIAGGFRFSGTDRFPEDGLHKVGDKTSRPGDVVFTSKGTVGRFAFVRADTEPFVYSPQLCFWRPMDRKAIDPYFLYCWMRGPEFFEQFKAVASQTDMAEYVSLTDQRRMFITLPPLDEQRVIGHIVGTLDGKIELNRRMNETLEAMTRALFKSWFVDFDPVRAKSALRGHAARAAPRAAQHTSGITPPLGGSRAAKGGSPQADRWGVRSDEARRRYSPKTLERARALRRNQTDAEGLLWHHLRSKQLGGFKFRRQHPVGPYIADFICLSHKLIVEIDGGQHAEQKVRDSRRDAFLRGESYRVLRFWNNEVFENCFGVLERIFAALHGDKAADSGAGGADRGSATHPPPEPPTPDGLAVPTPPQGGSNWTVERARAYLDTMDPAIADLFPDRLVESGLGETPEGWSVGTVADVAKQSGTGVDPMSVDQDTPYIGLEHIPRHSVALTDWGSAGSVSSNKSSFSKGDVLFGKLRPYFHKAGIAPVDGVCSTDIVVLTARMPELSAFVLACVSSPEFVSYTNQTSTGTKMPRTSWRSMSRYELCRPAEPIAKAFQCVAGPMLARVITNIHESRTLGTLRDALLPKLVSGDLRVRDAERLVAAIP